MLMSGLALVLITWVYFLGIRSERTGFVDRVLDPGIKRLTRPVLNAFRGRPPEVPMLWVGWPIAVDESADTLLAQGLNPWVPVHARLNMDTIHLWVDTASLNGPEGLVRLRAATGLMGMTTVHARPARNDGALWSWWFKELWMSQGAPGLGAELVEMDMGDKAGGLFLLEQELDSAWLAQHGVSTALALDDALLANARHAMAQRRFPAMEPRQADWSNAPVQVMQVVNGAEGALSVHRAVERLEAFRRGTMPASQVLDADAAARLLALSDMLGAGAAMHWWNMWFVPDSATGRLVMVPKRIEAGRPTDTLQVYRTSMPLRSPMEGTSFHDRLFGDPLIYHSYMAYLDSFSGPGWMAAVQAALGEGLQHRYRIVQAEYPGTVLDPGVMEHAQALARNDLHPADPALVYTQGVPDRFHRLVAASVHALPVMVYGAVAGADTILIQPPQILWPRRTGSPLSFVALRLNMPATAHPDLRALTGVMGTDDRVTVPVRTWSTLPASRTP